MLAFSQIVARARLKTTCGQIRSLGHPVFLHDACSVTDAFDQQYDLWSHYVFGSCSCCWSQPARRYEKFQPVFLQHCFHLVYFAETIAPITLQKCCYYYSVKSTIVVLKTRSGAFGVCWQQQNTTWRFYIDFSYYFVLQILQPYNPATLEMRSNVAFFVSKGIHPEILLQHWLSLRETCPHV